MSEKMQLFTDEMVDRGYTLTEGESKTIVCKNETICVSVANQLIEEAPNESVVEYVGQEFNRVESEHKENMKRGI